MRTPRRAARGRVALLLLALPIGCAHAPPEGGEARGAGAHHEGHPHGGPVGHRFQDAARWAKVFDEPGRDAWQRPAEVIALLALAPGMVAADLGAGTGYFLPHLGRAVGPTGRVLALDVEPDLVRYMRDRAARERLDNVRVVQVAYDDPGLAPGSVDRILVVDTWHHLGDRAAYARRLARALAPGGAVVVVDFTAESPHGPPPHARLPAATVAAELAAAGLLAEVAVEALPDQYVVIGRAR